MTEFERSLQKVLVHEGGFSNNPKDPGGPTMKGVTQRVYDSFRQSRNLPTQTVKAISTGEIETIYKQRYWDMFKGDDMPAGVGYVVFDGAVNSGVGQSVKWLQRALGSRYTGAVDGLVGQGTLAAIDEHPDKGALIADICKLRLAFLQSLKTWPTFGKGWASRVNDVCRVGQAWADGNTAMHLVSTQLGETAKALASDASTPPPVAPGDLAAGAGTVSVIISQTIDKLAPIQSLPSVATIVTWLTVAGAVIAIGGLAYRFWAARRKAEIKKATA